MRQSLNLSRVEIQRAVNETNSMLQASRFLGVTYTSFIRYAKKYGLYAQNQGGRGISKGKGKFKLPLDQLLVKNSSIGSAKLKVRLYKAGMKKPICEICGQGDVWNGKPLVHHLDHKDGDNRNNTLENLQILCPSCHSQTETYCRGQSRKFKTLRG